MMHVACEQFFSNCGSLILKFYTRNFSLNGSSLTIEHLVTCPVPSVVNGNVLNPSPLPVGDTTQVTCDAGYVLEGESTCQLTGALDVIPTCNGGLFVLFTVNKPLQKVFINLVVV